MPVVIDILFVAVAALTVFICAKRGFFLSLLKFFKAFLALGAAFLWGKTFGAFLADKFIYGSVYNSVFAKVSQLAESAALSAEEALKSVPGFLQTAEMKEQINSAIANSGENAMNLAESISTNIATTVSNVIGTIIGFIAIFLIAFVALTVIYFVIKGLKKRFGLIGKLDALVGGILGLALAFMILFLAGSALKLFFAGNPESAYNATHIAKFFGESAFGFLNINKLISGFIGA